MSRKRDNRKNKTHITVNQYTFLRPRNPRKKITDLACRGSVRVWKLAYRTTSAACACVQRVSAAATASDGDQRSSLYYFVSRGRGRASSLASALAHLSIYGRTRIGEAIWWPNRRRRSRQLAARRVTGSRRSGSLGPRVVFVFRENCTRSIGYFLDTHFFFFFLK